jgi:hypothetical protein
MLSMSQFYGWFLSVWAWSYESSAVGDPQSHLLDIVRVADMRNAAAGVSGLLAYDVYGYYQLLEGPYESILQLRRSIMRDRRHRVNWQSTVPRRERRTPLSLPMAFIPTDIPHGGLLRPGNARVQAAFETSLLERAAQNYPNSYAANTQMADVPRYSSAARG